MKTLLYKLFVVFFYYVGDIACRFTFDSTFWLYQKCMSLSLSFDDKIGNWWWKEPSSLN